MVKDAELSDAGLYTVEADNVDLGSASADFDVSVNVQGEHNFLCDSKLLEWFAIWHTILTSFCYCSN